MGSDKYPRVNEYADFVVNNGGFLNAYTDYWNTNYHFSIANGGLEHGLDIFSHVFIHPLLDKSCVDKEINAVNSEWENNLQSDSWRLYQLFNNWSNPDSSFNIFGCGNLDTLNKDDIYDRLKEFHDKWYSSNIMKLVVYSNKPLDEIEAIIRDKFSLIPNNNVIIPSLSEPVWFPKENLCKLIKMKTIKTINEINMFFILKWFENDGHRPLTYITHVLGHEGKNSLLSFLINEELATGIIAGYYHRLHAFSFIQLTITLTDKGINEYERVVEIVFAMIKVIQTEPISDHVYDEYRK